MAAHPADRRGEGDEAGGIRSRRGWYLLLLIPFAALLYPPLYAHTRPSAWGIPFFYWYQVVWLAVTAAISTIVYRKTR